MMKPPSRLKATGRKFWKRANKETVYEESHDTERLEIGCKCLDDIREAEDQVKLDGMFIKDRYGCIREHPAIKVIRDNRIIFLRVIRELGLDIETPGETRIPRRY